MSGDLISSIRTFFIIDFFLFPGNDFFMHLKSKRKHQFMIQDPMRARNRLFLLRIRD